MQKNDPHAEDLKVIRQMMERSSRFLSLSGWSGISAGVFALLGAVAAYLILRSVNDAHRESYLLADALLVLLLALASSLFFSWRKAKELGTRLWSPVTRKLLFNMAVPLVTGGIYCAILITQERADLVAGATLIFYGFSLIQAGRFTNREAVILGLAEVFLGLLASVWRELGLWLWAVGFGLLHILYGAVLYFRYERSQSEKTN